MNYEEKLDEVARYLSHNVQFRDNWTLALIQATTILKILGIRKDS